MIDQKFNWVERWTNIWRLSMLSSDMQLGFPNQSLVICSGYGENRSITEDWQHEIDLRAVGVIDAALDDMPAVESAVFFHVQLGCAFRFAVPVEIPYARAMFLIGERLKAAAFS